jgi:hypothetical protein
MGCCPRCVGCTAHLGHLQFRYHDCNLKQKKTLAVLTLDCILHFKRVHTTSRVNIRFVSLSLSRPFAKTVLYLFFVLYVFRESLRIACDIVVVTHCRYRNAMSRTAPPDGLQRHNARLFWGFVLVAAFALLPWSWITTPTLLFLLVVFL